MSITIDALASGTSSNSYITLTEANTYFEAVPWFDSLWDALTDDQKNARIVQAARAIDRLNLEGARYLDDQMMEFPRDLTDQSTNDGEMPQKVKDAQCELIIWQYQHMDSATGDADRQVDEVSLGKGEIHVKYTQYKNVDHNLAGGMPESVRALLRTWLLSSSNVVIDRV